ncbi:class I SAM-dependent DNA methyltransferase [Rubritalea profundi]|uniref:site-specific DNA-methyltransferase (adenine-specific) n=1 Tax=Rubritalea profundi TaxID=1658618 RepID=A0A2S7U6S9_9BACT|nr:DNA methyltransferase [Rubritalea profundi]PQJ30171.1 SAM-dependent methyltransferase [Rubritalea profundi]
MSSSSSVETFISRWQNSGAAERSNYALFISELCDLLEVERPQPSSEHNNQNDYVIDRAFTRKDKDDNNSTVYLDLYKRGHFVLETKQGSNESGGKVGHGKRGTKGWDKALDKAYHQARAYIRDLPAEHGRPPFLIVADVGHCFDVYAEFTGTGGTYLAYPNPAKRRIFLEDLKQPETRELLKTIWSTPHKLDPSKHAAKVTREVADTLALLATSLEKENHDPQTIATFLQRILFTLFAEDIGLLPEKAFENLLISIKDTPKGFPVMVSSLWNEMATGTEFSTILHKEIAYFNGGLFDNPTALPLDTPQIELIIHAAKQDWTEVEPAIFGTLLERALDPTERHKLGAHYTPRSYVDRLIEPTLMQPLRENWDAVKTAAALLHDANKDDKAREEIENFHRQLCAIRVLDPACGSGNFLYVALARMKELEAEVLDLLDALGGNRTLEMDSFKVRPDQFLGLEINERACAIAQLVLWIGYFQWHHKTTGTADTNDRPLLPKQQTISHKDAVLDYDAQIPRTDPDTGEFLTIWDGRTTKPHPVTGKEVPDETARKPLYDYTNPRRTEWPQAEYIVGNPPFLGNKRMREGLGDGYVEALRTAWKKHKAGSWDFVMFWWHQAAELARDGKTNQFGFITTNSIHQTFNRRCVEAFLNNDKKPTSITFAIPDHPWVDSADGAAVRIAMSVAKHGNAIGVIKNVSSEEELSSGEIEILFSRKKGKVLANLKIGAHTSSAYSLKSNEILSGQGVIVLGEGFQLSQSEADSFKIAHPNSAHLIKRYMNGSDLVRVSRNLRIIDLHGLTEKQVTEHPLIYQRVYDEVRPKRLQMNDKQRREKWWLFGRSNQILRNAITGLDRYIATCRTAKHRTFTFLTGDILPDAKIVAIGSADSDVLSSLSSSIHCLWAHHTGAFLEDRPNYNHADCFNKFPFPEFPDGELKETLRTLGEQLDAHRKARQAEHPDLTLTGMYNVLEKLRKEEPLTDKDKVIYDHGLVTLLKQIHDDIDDAVVEAYRRSGFQPLSNYLDNTAKSLDGSSTATPIADRLARGDEALEQAILQSLVDLNHERAAEEAQGKIRYLRPDFQDPENTQASTSTQTLETADLKLATKKTKTTSKLKWPKPLPEQVTIIKDLCATHGTNAETLSQLFGRASKSRHTQIDQILQTLTALGQI